MTPGTRIINKLRQLEATVAKSPDWWTGKPLLWVEKIKRIGSEIEALPYDSPIPVEHPEDWTPANAGVVQAFPKGRW